jgi:hemolysin activation/secretion protein
MRWLHFALWIGVCNVSHFLSAAEPTPGERELIRERQQLLLDEQRQRLDELRNLPGELDRPTASDPAEQERCLDIRKIELRGAELVDAGDQSRLLAPYIGQCLGPTRLNELLRAVTHFYLDCGYVTSRAYLPQQDLSQGQLEIRVVEGRLEGLDGREGGLSDRQLRMAFPGKTGERLNLRELEQMVDQLGRLPSQQARIELKPGEQIGGSRVQLLSESSKPWRVRLARHNDGERSTGEQQWGLGFDWDNPLGMNDQLVLRAGRDAVSDSYRHSHQQALNYSLPWGWWTFRYGYNQSYYRTLNQGAGFNFKVDGDSNNHYLRAERVLHRDALSKSGMHLAVSHQRSRNYIQDSLIDVSSQRLSELSVGLNHGRRIGHAFVNADIGWQHGIGAFDAQRAGQPRSGEPVARYNKYNLTLSYLQPFERWGESFSVDSLLHIQRSEDVLFAAQRISIGGRHSVRGFKDQSLSGDSGGYWRNNLRWRRTLNWQALRPLLSEYSVALAYDIGQIKSDAYNPRRRGRMSGNAIELSARGEHLAASLTFARSLDRPGVIGQEEHPLHFRIDLNF